MSTQKTKDIQLSNSFSLEYIPVTTKNYKQAIKIQNKIFHEHFPKEIKNSCYPSQNILYNYSKYWLVKHHNKTVGITGLYSFQQYPHDVFLNWYGVVPSSRKHGFGKQIVLWTIEQARNKDFDIINIFGIIYKNIDNERAKFKEMLEFVKREKEKIAIVMYDNKQLPQSPFLKNELMNLVIDNKIELYYANDRIRLSSIE